LRETAAFSNVYSKGNYSFKFRWGFMGASGKSPRAIEQNPHSEAGTNIIGELAEGAIACVEILTSVIAQADIPILALGTGNQINR